MSYITINAADGGQFAAWYAAPAGSGDRPGLVLIQEIFGVNAVMRDLADGFAAQGYHVLCPDIFWRIEPGVDITDQSQAEWDKAFELFGKFDTDLGVRDLDTTLAAVRELDGCTGKAGAVGYCLGGKLAYLMAARTDVDCAVSYYGVGIEGLLSEAGETLSPWLSHIASGDSFVPAEAQQAVIAALGDAPGVSLHVYEGQEHAFARVGGAHYDEASATLANRRTEEFLSSSLR